MYEGAGSLSLVFVLIAKRRVPAAVSEGRAEVLCPAQCLCVP